jgi:ParB family chromosome partitioning protein
VREDLRPIAQAHASTALMERRGWSYRELGAYLPISKGEIAKALALLDLPEAVQEATSAWVTPGRE